MTATSQRVHDVVQREPVLIDGMATIRQALDIMQAQKLSALVVKRRDPQDEYGLLLLTEIARMVLSNNRSLERTNAYEVMIKPAPSIDAEMAIKYAIRHMARFQLSHCVVLNGRELSGVVTLNEMALTFRES
jgi:signal-transduction protein with cAMP-binding, CBS, and nucleotidyltransferase domain